MPRRGRDPGRLERERREGDEESGYLPELRKHTATLREVVQPSGDIILFASNIATDTVIGTKIGTTADQKFGFFGATPVTQRTGVAVSDAAIHAALVSLGLITA